MTALVVLASLATIRMPLAAAEIAPAWTGLRYDTANTAFNPSERWLSTGNVTSLDQDWSVQVDPKESPLVIGGVVYVGCEGESFCALDATSGAVRWKTDLGKAPWPPRSTALVGGVVYTNAMAEAVTTFSAAPTVVALDAGTGAVLWSTRIMNGCCQGPLQPLPGMTYDRLSTPLAVAEGLVMQRWGHFLFAWDAAMGIQRWVVRVAAGGVPAIVNGVVYVQANTPSPTLHALRATTGESLWTSLPVNGESGAAIVSGGLVIVASDQTASSGRLSAYRATGCGASQCAPVWSTAVSPALSGAGAVAGGVLYQGLADGSYAAIEAGTGRPLWKATTTALGQPATAPTGAATVANGLLFGQASGNLYAWAAAGCGTAACPPLWSRPVGPVMWADGDIVVAHGRVYVASTTAGHETVPEYGTVFAFSPRKDPPPAVTPPPVVPVVAPPVRTVPTTLRVPQDHLSIQRAIEASIAGDVVVVAPGVYHERIDFRGHAVEVRSAGGPDVTTIDADGVSTAVAFQARETRASVLRGFTIRNGVASDLGGGIRVAWSSPTIAGNVITGNKGYGGNGILVTGGSPAIVGNQVRDNHTIEGWGSFSGGGIALDADAGTEVRGNIIEDNSAGSGGGLLVSSPAPITVADNVIRRNTAETVGGGAGVGGATVFVQNVVVDNSAGVSGGGVLAGVWPTLVSNTIAGNTSPRASGVDTQDAGPDMSFKGNVITGPPGTGVLDCGEHYERGAPSFEGNLVYNGDPQPSVRCEDHSLSADPWFVSPGAGDYRLGRGSPAIDGGGITSPLLPGVDVTGAPRVVDGNGDGRAVVDIGAYEAQLPVPEVVRDGFNPVTPARLLDTRSGVGGPAKRLGAGATLDLQVTGRGGVPVTGVSSVVLNVTVTETTATSFLTAWPSGVARPLASYLNYVAGQTVPNLVTVKVGTGGKVSLYNLAGTTHVVADVTGWYGAGDGSPFTPVTPSRILDTRVGEGAPAGRLGPASTIPLQVTGRGGVPATGVSAVVLNVTVTEPTATSFLTAWPAGVARPPTSNLNLVAGQTVPNLVIVKVGDGGKVNLYNNAGMVHVIADVAGWFGEAADSGFTSLPPARVLDTRNHAGKPGPASVESLQVTGRGGVPETGVSAVVLNVTVTEPTAGSFLTGWPAGEDRPLASNLNYVAGLTVPNLVVVKVGDDGKVNLYNYDGWTHVIADVAGWYG